MKKNLSLLVLFFHLTSYGIPLQVHAIVHVAAVIIPAAAVGAALVAGAAGTYYAQTGKTPAWVSATANAAASAADYIFSPAFMAAAPVTLVTAASFPQVAQNYIGKNAWLGVKIDKLIDAAKNAAAGVCDTLKAKIAARSSDGTPVEPTLNVTIETPEHIFAMAQFTGLVKSSSSADISTLPGNWKFTGFANYYGTTLPNGTNTPYYVISGNQMYIYARSGPYSGPFNYNVYIYNNVGSTSSNWTPPPPAGAVDYPGLKDDLFPWLTGSPADINNLLKTMGTSDIRPAEGDSCPLTVDTASAAPTAVTPAEKNAAIDANNVDVAKKAAEVAQQAAAANPSDAAAQVNNVNVQQNTANVINEAAKDNPTQTQEYFGAIPVNPFSVPITTDPFDIPARFTTFIGRVKNSPICKFSQDFFKSIPGGGTPIYEIEAGQFGHHTIDLSQTLASGLAVLKTILLLCFGFLSIRAVIMKR